MASSKGMLAAAGFTVGMVILGLGANAYSRGLMATVGGVIAVASLALGISSDARSLRSQLALCWPARPLLNVAPGLLFGAALALVHRQVVGAVLLPATLTVTALSAAAIGVCEELAFRGFVQGRLARHGPLVACTLAALAHTAYKCSLFARLPGGSEVSLLSLAVFTFAVGLAFGHATARSRSLLWAGLAHGIFDLVAYGDQSQLPWWT